MSFSQDLELWTITYVNGILTRTPLPAFAVSAESRRKIDDLFIENPTITLVSTGHYRATFHKIYPQGVVHKLIWSVTYDEGDDPLLDTREFTAPPEIDIHVAPEEPLPTIPELEPLTPDEILDEKARVFLRSHPEYYAVEYGTIDDGFFLIPHTNSSRVRPDAYYMLQEAAEMIEFFV